jgi:CRP-like cAMP-binding protein
MDEGHHLVAANAPIECVYFPETAVVCLCAQTTDARSMEIGVVGRDGLIGWQGLLGCGQSAHGDAVQVAGGSALVLTAQQLLASCAASPTLLTSLLRFVHVFTVQMAQTIVSNLSDPLDRRLCRWLLMLHDRLDGDVISVTHSTLAALLNVRRASVTDALHILEGERILSCTRGKIAVRDRATLENRAGTAYGVPEAAYSNAISAFGK